MRYNIAMDIKEKLAMLPLDSGVYIMRDKYGAIIYIGKAVVLKNRVRQYFNNSPKLAKVEAMVSNVEDFEYIITLNEKDALALESNLIKKHKPKYNILLKDDKASPYIKIDLSQEFPTIEVTRKVKRDGAKYFGPYFNGVAVWDIVGIIRSAYQMRTCPKKFNNKGRECLNFHIKLCLAPCCGYVDRAQYMVVVNKVMAFLSGREDGAQRLINEKMADAVLREEFERAIVYRNQLGMLVKMKERSVANLGSVMDIDSFSYVTNGEYSVISVCIVRAGKMLGVKNFTITDATLEISDALSGFITQYYNGGEVPEQISLPIEFDTAALSEYLYSISKNKVEFVFPKAGMKKQLLTTAENNSRDYLNKSVERFRHSQNMTVGAANQLAKILGLSHIRRMECYDISNISGVDKVASQVVFIDGAASKSDYRKYKIKTVEGANDFASMSEVIKRRLQRAQDGDDKFKELPDLIVIDGGKGQLSSAFGTMIEMGENIPMVGLAEREEEIFTVGSSEPIVLPRDNNALKLLQRIRDEAHRFAITFHRNLRSHRYDSELEKIPNVGKVKRIALLKSFVTIKAIREATVEQLENIVDKRAALCVYDYFRKAAQEVADAKLPKQAVKKTQKTQRKINDGQDDIFV